MVAHQVCEKLQKNTSLDPKKALEEIRATAAAMSDHLTRALDNDALLDKMAADLISTGWEDSGPSAFENTFCNIHQIFKNLGF